MIRFIKKFAVFFIAALVLTFIWFKTAGAAETQDAARLEALAKRLNDFTSLEADFTQKRTLGAAGRTLTSTGTLSLTGDGAFSWVQKTPFVQTVSLKDGVFTIRYEDEAPEVMKAETHPAVLSAARLLTSVMRLDAAALQDAFDYTLVGGEKPADAWTITLRARDEALGRILGTVTLKGSEYVESIRMSPSNDNVTDMILSNVRIVKGA
ncbi:MAG: outer membrane lipoprotein carrier protein LolA [Sutterella wadsworthensis]|nr:outer membrane lipoprotein carrier protein LolA [Sutterella wadsworthensis]MDY5224125.1 outer membrane lipoprotein carrier protein LolA [Sutterella wadsworthensis]